MSELTNKRLEEIASGQNTVSIPEAVELARELLTLRTLRDAGDEEVEQMKGMIRKCIYGIPDSEGKIARDMLDNIVDIAITRGQQLREAMEEIERLKSAPAMEEVDALVAKEDSLSAKMSAGHYLLFINACDIARRSNTSREEVVGLLKELWWKIPSSETVHYKGEWVQRIRKIVEGK